MQRLVVAYAGNRLNHRQRTGNTVRQGGLVLAHQHLAIIEALRQRDGEAAARAIRDDIIEGGTRLVDLLGQLEDGRAAITEDAEGTLSLAFNERAA